MELSEEIKEALETLKASYEALQKQFVNPAAHAHHLLEAAQAVRTDAHWLEAMVVAFATKHDNKNG